MSEKALQGQARLSKSVGSFLPQKNSKFNVLYEKIVFAAARKYFCGKK